MDNGMHRLDARGLMCPEPVRRAETESRALAPGEELRILVTDPAAPLDLEAWCLRRGHRWLGISTVGDGAHEIRVTIALPSSG